MTIARRLGLQAIALATLTAAGALPAAAQTAGNYPNKPIKLIVPFAAGGSTDVVARVLAEGLRTTLGQSIVVDNRAGAGGLLGTEAVAQAPADGYTVGMATVSTMTINPLLFKRAESLGAKLTPVAQLVTMPSVYMVHPKLGVKTFEEFLAKVKAEPGKISGAVPGLGTLGHLMLASFNETLKTDILIVPYRGSGLQLVDFTGPFGPAKALHAFGNGAAGDHDRLAPVLDKQRKLAAPLANGRLVQASSLIGNQARANLDDDASGSTEHFGPIFGFVFGHLCFIYDHKQLFFQ